MNYVQFIINYKSNFIIKNSSASLNPSLIPSLNPSLNETPLARSHPKISPVKCVNGTVKTVNAIHGRGGVISLKYSPAPPFSNPIGSLFCRISQCLLSMAEICRSRLSIFLLLPSFRYSRLIVFVSLHMNPIPIFLFSLLFVDCSSKLVQSNGWQGDVSHTSRSVQSSFLVIGGRFSSMRCNYHPARNCPTMAIQ